MEDLHCARISIIVLLLAVNNIGGFALLKGCHRIDTTTPVTLLQSEWLRWLLKHKFNQNFQPSKRASNKLQNCSGDEGLTSIPLSMALGFVMWIHVYDLNRITTSKQGTSTGRKVFNPQGLQSTVDLQHKHLSKIRGRHVSQTSQKYKSNIHVGSKWDRRKLHDKIPGHRVDRLHGSVTSTIFIQNCPQTCIFWQNSPNTTQLRCWRQRNMK